MSSDHFTMTINGAAERGLESFEIENPASGNVFAVAPDCTQAELDLAVASARDAFHSWRTVPIEERRTLIKSFAQKLEQEAKNLAPLLTEEQGKTKVDALTDIMGGAWWLDETCRYDLPDIISEDSAARLVVTRREPIGVVAAIVPWNYPVMLAMLKVAPALLAGNTLILKPAPTTPLTTLRIGEIAREIFPAGVLNVISGSDKLGPLITSHPGIDKVSFTGSTQTGRQVMRSAAATLKSLTLELGGNDACIVMPSVDVEALAPGLFWAAFTNAGQVCIAAKRLYIHEDIYEPMKAAIAAYAKTVKVGRGSDPDTQIGPVQNRAQFKRVESLIQDAHDNGYEFLMGGKVTPGEGYFIPVSILDNPPESARIVQEEQFGPVLPLMKFSSVDELIDRVNESELGLGASVWSNDSGEADAIARRLNVGTVWINEGQNLSPHASFGGWKQSGLGSEGAQSGLEAYTIPKTVFKTRVAGGAG